MILQWFMEDLMIVSGLVHLDDVLKSKDGRPREEGVL